MMNFIGLNQQSFKVYTACLSNRGILPALVIITVLLSSGCTPTLGPYLHRQELVHTHPSLDQHFGSSLPYQPDAPVIVAVGESIMQTPNFTATEPVPLSPGDRLQINVHNGEPFSGLFEVDMDGNLKVPYLQPIRAYGHSIEAVEQALKNALVGNKLFHHESIMLSIRVQQWAPIHVHVGGAVFNPGLVTTNARSPEEREQKSQQLSGDFPMDRLLPAALRAAGGIRPDATIEKIKIIRNGITRVINLKGLMSGYPVIPVALVSGDTIIVPSSQRFDSRLVAPSAITPPGVRVFLSTLTSPAPGNAAAAVERHATSIPYGSRLLTAAVSANCVGGTNMTNGSRHLVLIRTDPISGREETLKRSVDQLLQAPAQNDINPFMMPNDSVACYDSGVTNLRDISRSFADIVLPFTLLLLL